MIEKIINDFLNENDIKSFTEIPGNPPGAFCVIEKTGSALTNHIKQATVAIQSIGDSLLEAGTLNETIKSLMLYELVKSPEIGSVRLNSDYNFTNPQTKKRRYQAIFVVTYY